MDVAQDVLFVELVLRLLRVSIVLGLTSSSLYADGYLSYLTVFCI